MWRVVLADKGALSDIEQFWSVTDVLDANDAIDFMDLVVEATNKRES